MRSLSAYRLAVTLLAALPAAACGLLNKPGVTDAGSVTPSGALRQAQLILQQQGTYAGGIDGVPGPATTDALRLYQQAHGLPTTGALDDATRRSLNIGAAPAAETATTAMSDGSKMSAEDARRLIESQGYTDVNGLYRDDSAIWRGMATRAGKTGEVAIDAAGHVLTD